MLLNFSRESSISTAVCKTFDGKHPCALCKLVQAAKQNEKKPDAQSSFQKFDLIGGQAGAYIFPPAPISVFRWSLARVDYSAPPLLRPPRTFSC